MGARRWSPKQIRYLWAIGFFKKGAGSGSGHSVKTFSSPEDADRWGAKQLGELFHSPDSPLKDRQDLREAVDDYRGVSFRAINASLRRSSGKDTSEPSVAKIDEAFDKYARSTTEPVKVVRGMRAGFAELLSSSYDSGKLREGATLRDYGYMSTSLNPQMGGKFTGGSGATSGVLEITVPSGTKALFLGSNYESEILLPRGSEVKLTSVKKSYSRDIFGNSKTLIQMTGELIPRERR